MSRVSVAALALLSIAALPAIAADVSPPESVQPGATGNVPVVAKAPRKKPEERDSCKRQTGLPSVHGRGGNDRLYGGGFAYQMFGDEDRDFLLGSSGDDEVNGGDDADLLIGGAGADLFVYDTEFASLSDKKGRWSPETGDTIVDFQSGERDKIDLTQTQKYGAGAPATFQWSGSEAQPYAVWAVAKDGDTFLAVDRDGDSQADMAIRLLGKVHLTPSDFCGVEPEAS